MATALHEAAHAIAALCCNGRVTRMMLNGDGGEVPHGHEGFWDEAVVCAAGPVSDIHFGRARDRISSDQVDLLAAARKVDPGNTEAICMAAEVAARAIVVENEKAIQVLARALWEVGELDEREIEAVVAGFAPFHPPPPPPMSADWARALSGVVEPPVRYYVRGRSGDLIGHVEQLRAGQWTAYDLHGGTHGSYSSSNAATRALQ